MLTGDDEQLDDDLNELQQFINSGNLEHLDNMVAEFANQYLPNDAQDSTILSNNHLTENSNNNNNVGPA